MLQRSNSPLMFTSYPEAARSESPLSLAGTSSRHFQQQHQQAHALNEEPSTFQSGVKHAGWLWKCFGHGHKTKWKRLWFYLEDDRLCYCQADAAGSSSSGSSNRPSSSPAFTSFGMSMRNAAAAGLSSTSSSSAALAAGHVKYIPLDRISVRPLPHRQHALDPMHRSHPDVGVAIIDARVLTGQPANSPTRTVFSLVAGSHTHYLAADTLREAQHWVTAVRECWLHCFSHTARSTGAVAGSSGAVVSQRLLAENAQLRESIQELDQKVAETDSEYWRKWVEEKAKNQVLESKLVNAATYEVLVKTGSMKGAATDARVYIELYGPDFCASPTAAAAAGMTAGVHMQQTQQQQYGASAAGISAGLAGVMDCCGGEVRLFDIDSHAKPFQKGAADSFTVLCHNVGLPARLKVWHDNTGCHPDWFLAEVKVRKKGSKDWVCFPCNRWLSTQLDDERICRELMAGASRPLVTYQVVTHTSDLRGAGTDAGVYVQLHGLLGDGLRQQLVGGPNDFGRGGINELHVEDSDLVALAGVNAKAGVTYLFPCDAWLDERLGDGKTERRLQAATALGSKVWYTLHISTSDVRGAGTDADVHVVLVGSDGSSDRVQLPSKPEHFERGSRDTFRLQLAPLGRLEKLLTGHNGLGDSPSWHLSLVEVVEEATGRVTYFAADRWLGAASGDGLSEVTLAASSVDPRRALVEYQLCFLTSQLRGSGTDSTVHFELHGDRGSSGPTKVAAGREAFERGGSDSFSYSLPWLGQLQRLAVWHDNSGAAGGRGPWHLEAVEVSSSREQQVVTFPCGRWLSVESQLKVELQPGHAAGLTRYRFDVITSNVRGAGTDGALSIELLGSNPAASGSTPQGSTAAGSTPASAGPWCLDRPGAFARGRTDSFVVRGLEVVQPSALKVELQGASLNPDWHLSHVMCTVLEGEEGSEGQKWYFNAERWFDAAHGFSASLPCSSRPPGRPDEGQLPYVIKVFTSDVKGAGTDANISVNVMGLKGHSGWQQLRARQDSFERGQEDCFTLKLPDLGPLTHLALKSDGAGEGPAWHLDKPVWFVVRRWLDAAHGLEVLLEAQGSDPAKSLVAYGVEVYTSDLKNAGTDARVMLQLLGDQGSSSPLELQDAAAPADCFLRGSGDAFSLQLPRLGALAKARLWLEGPGSPWHLQLLVVTGRDGDVTYFPCNTWLRMAAAGSSEGGVLGTAAQPMELLGSREDPRQQLREYKVVTRTSDVRGAATDAAVHIELIGDGGSSGGLQPLIASGPQAFERGSTDEFRLLLGQGLGQLQQLRVLLDGSGARHPAWHLLQVEVTDVAAGRTWYFEADCWLDAAAAGQGSAGRAERLFIASSNNPLADRKTYQVTVYTSKREGAGTDGAVYATLHGSQGLPITSAPAGSSTGTASPAQRQQQQPDKAASPSSAAAAAAAAAAGWRSSGRHELRGGRAGGLGEGSAVSVTLPSMRSLGQLRQLTLELESVTGERCSWHCQHLELQLEQQQQQQQELTVAVYTANVPGAGTDAAVSITLYGAAGAAGPFKLSAPGRSCFEQGGCDVFSIKAGGKLGQLLRLKVAVDGSGSSKSGWLLDTISVTAKSSGGISWFYAGRWLGAAAGLEAELEGSDGDVRGQLVTYKVTVHTGDVRNAGTDARVYIDLQGSACRSGPQALSKPIPNSSSSSSNCFERGQADSFEVACRELGELFELVVWHDGSGMGSGWNLAYVEVQHTPSSQVWYFPCNQWLDSSQGDGATRRTLKAARSFDPASLQCKYRVAVTTANVRGAGTDANVHIVIHGNQGDTGQKALAKQGHKCFERGRRDEFVVSGADVGAMSHVVLGHEGSGLGPAWHVAELEVQHMGTGQLLKFIVNRWLDAKRPGGSLQCELWPDAPGQQQAAEAQPADSSQGAVEWELVVITGKVLGAGTDADVSITLKGSSSSFGPYMLPAGPEAFETGCRDKFKLSTPELGDLQEVVIGHNNLGLGPAWFLQGLELQNLSSGAKYVFKVSAWLDVQSGCSRTLKAVQQQQGQGLLGKQGARGGLSSCSYQLEIQTSDVEGAGTDAAVFVQLAGAQGESEAMQLQAAGSSSTGINARALFQRGSLDVFILRGLPDVGALTHLLIGHDGSGTHPAWHLAWVRVVNLATGDRALFTANTWLDATLPGSNTWMQLPATPDTSAAAGGAAEQQQQQPGQLGGRGGLFGAREDAAAAGAMKLTKAWLHTSKLGQPGYTVVFTTSNIMGAGTAARVFFELIGEHGSSGVVYATSQPGQFSRGHTDSFLYPRLPYLGQLHQLRVVTGAGMMAVPRAYLQVGWLLGTVMLLGVAALTYFTLAVLVHGSAQTGAATYSQLVQVTCGHVATKVLQLSVLSFCFGFSVVYLVVIRDLLLGSPPHCNGLLCELLGLDPSGALADPRLVIAAVALLICAPLLLLRSMDSLAFLNVVGLAAVVLLAAVAALLGATAVADGVAHGIPMLPQWQLLGPDKAAQLETLAGVLPVILASYVMHQNLHPAMPLLRPYSPGRINVPAAAEQHFVVD
ncbi:hypothetical protein OEZ85_013981 [Tetradesmus obliquus]|uniref:Uncharacterized protein n=1 Tax=Tetradesmus obliquus TaxID=3088 RepID=A0ABY8U723_TETOB|nr:hypothetical protein OEZ85_013981 [Tetradesmus obliquus]